MRTAFNFFPPRHQRLLRHFSPYHYTRTNVALILCFDSSFHRSFSYIRAPRLPSLDGELLSPLALGSHPWREEPTLDFLTQGRATRLKRELRSEWPRRRMSHGVSTLRASEFSSRGLLLPLLVVSRPFTSCPFLVEYWGEKKFLKAF